MTDGTGTTTYGYDTGNRLTTVTKGVDTFTYVSDPSGNVTSRTYPDGRTITATFNDAGETATVNDGNGAVTYTYDPAGNLNQMVLPAGVTQNRVYDRASRLTNINNQRAGGVFSQFTYTRDANGNPTAIDIAGTGAPTLDSQRNTFDTYDRLTKTCFTTTTCTTANQTIWTYDKVGNRLNQSKDLFPCGMTDDQVERSIREAYGNSRLVATQYRFDGVVAKRLQGRSGQLVIEMWLNVDERIIETAYPIVGGWRIGG
jgi:YD repeat-containing protein